MVVGGWMGGVYIDQRQLVDISHYGNHVSRDAAFCLKEIHVDRGRGIGRV